MEFLFFFVEKKVDGSVLWREIYWRLPWCCNHFIIISTSQTKVEKTDFFIVFSTKVSKLNFEKKNFRLPIEVSGSVSKWENDHFGMSLCFFFVGKKLTIVFFGMNLTGDYRNVAIISTLFRDHNQNSKKPIFHRFFDFSPWSRNNYVMLPTTW